MSEKNLPEQLKQDATGKQITAAPQSARRKLLKSTVAIPIIMTLHSGAALARTSNLVGAVDTGTAATVTDDLGQEQIVCVDSGDGPIEPGGSTYDLGLNPSATLGDASQDLETQAQSCQAGGGILISSTAFTSLQGRGFFTDL